MAVKSLGRDGEGTKMHDQFTHSSKNELCQNVCCCCSSHANGLADQMVDLR